MKTLRDQIVLTARSEAAKGRKWTKGGAIDRLVLDPYRPALLSLGHLSRGDPGARFSWCAAWTAYILAKSGVDLPKRYGRFSTALVSTVARLAKDLDSWKPPTASPQPGDLVLLNWDRDRAPDHIGILIDQHKAGGYYVLAEGNRRDQEGIFTRTRSQVFGIVDIEQLALELGQLEKEGVDFADLAPGLKKAG